MAMFKRVHKIRCFSLKWNTDTRFSVNPQFSLWKAMSVLPAGCMSFALLNLPDTYVLEFFVWHDLTDHRRIQEAGVLSVIERSGGLFGQVLKMETFCLKMEETPKWHKMTWRDRHHMIWHERHDMIRLTWHDMTWHDLTEMTMQDMTWPTWPYVTKQGVTWHMLQYA